MGQEVRNLMAISTVDLKISLEVNTRQDGDIWIAWCGPLDLYTQAEAKDSAIASLRDAIFAWFESCLERRVLAKALEEVGFKLVTPGQSPPSLAGTIRVEQAQRTQVEQSEHVEVSIPACIAAHLNSSPSAAR